MVENLQPKETVRAWVDAFNAVDVTRIANLYAEDATFHDMTQSIVSGRDAIRKMYANEFATFQIFCIVDEIKGDGHWVTLDWKDPNGVQGCGYFEVKNGEITHQRAYWDKASFLMFHTTPSLTN
ncbi:nuclear transport factor 2 family protein [Hirschia litorea]|uniref:Nuclear transport factor 2 family protein n=1 Tax=Hirschia litorea TaxID=1199156 RepID=A0ABW2IJL2_9PROT